MPELSDLVKEVRDGTEAVVYSPIFRNIVEETGSYSLTQLPDRVDQLQLGKDIVPRIGSLGVADNEWYELQNDSFRARYPELKESKIAGPSLVVEKVKSVSMKPEGIEVVAERYLIQQRVPVKTKV